MVGSALAADFSSPHEFSWFPRLVCMVVREEGIGREGRTYGDYFFGAFIFSLIPLH
ncbi:hypothetical protein KDAU_58110 [Dictyobacter aurantiacus]|uniref:Uncharacterized protein n=1 Tax=Dictyobacter aurantiacus TaxID=1936993 RepID=A0A401ZNQ5_9CHLR|nr:hypothetical protein KDAU_58110 [Dictyobacter aurantiacus]